MVSVAPEWEMDLPLSRVDHVPVVCHFAGTMRCHRHSPLRRKPKFDVRAFRDEDRAAAFAKDLSCIPLQPWSTDIDTQLEETDAKIIHLLQLHFPLPRSRPRADWVTKEVWALSRPRASALKQIAAAKFELKNATRATFFAAWVLAIPSVSSWPSWYCRAVPQLCQLCLLGAWLQCQLAFFEN